MEAISADQVLYSEHNYSDIEKLLLFYFRKTILKDAKLYLKVKVLAETEICKTQSPLWQPPISW